MDDLIVLLLTATVMIVGAISSANKKKKEKEAAERMARQQRQQRQAGETAGESDHGMGRSLSEIFEELTGQEMPRYDVETAGFPDDYNKDGTTASADAETAEERLRHITYVQPEKSIPAYARDNAGIAPEPEITQQSTLSDVLGEEFDLRRAVIESEILKPKYGQF